MTEHRVFEIFSAILGTEDIQRSQQDPDANRLELDCKQFEKAMQYVDLKKANLSMTALGININQLVFYLVVLAAILFAFLLFFLLAMQAFGINGSIGTIVNSLVPVGIIDIIILRVCCIFVEFSRDGKEYIFLSMRSNSYI